MKSKASMEYLFFLKIHFNIKSIKLLVMQLYWARDHRMQGRVIQYNQSYLQPQLAPVNNNIKQCSPSYFILLVMPNKYFKQKKFLGFHNYPNFLALERPSAHCFDRGQLGLTNNKYRCIYWCQNWSVWYKFWKALSESICCISV